MTTNFFTHNQVDVNSNTSPVENLANETSKGFSNISEFLKSSQPIPNFSSVIGNYLLLNINTHGIEEDTVEVFTIKKGSSQVTTKLYVKDSIASVSYLDDSTNTIKYLEQKNPSQTFDNNKQFKVLGKVIYLSGTLPTNTVKVSYKGVRNTFGNLKLKSNVIKDIDNSYIKKLVIESDNVVSITYTTNLQQQAEQIFNTIQPNKENTYLLITDNNEYKTLPYQDVYVEGNKIYFNLVEALTQPTDALVYVSNVTVGDFVTAFYEEYMAHEHGKNGNDRVVSHSNLIDLYNNTDLIFYKDTDIVNYPHPQYLNREGYNPTVGSAYENALLGDLFLSAKISDADTEYKTLLKNSNSILFGDPLKGSRLYFDSMKSSIVMLTGNDLNGLDVVVGVNKKAISINNDSFLSETDTDLSIKGKYNTVSIVATNDKESLLKTDGLQVKYKATVSVVDTDKLIMGTSQLYEDSNKNVVLEQTDTNSLSSFNINIPTNVKKLTSTVSSSQTHLIRSGDKIATDDNNSISKGTKGFEFTTEALNLRSTKKGSGLQLGENDNLKAQLYTANYLGDRATPKDSCLYLESPQSSDIYFIKSTQDTYNLNGVDYKFSTTDTGNNVINSLKEWKGAKLHLDEINASYLTLKPIDKVFKNGLRIGKTRITVIGEGLDCPEGMTILESLNTFHFIKPLPDNTTKCGDLSYQDVNLGKLQVFGEMMVEKSISTTDSLQVGNSIAADSLNISNTTTTQDLTVLGETTFLGESTANGSFNVNNKLNVTGETTLNGSLKSYDLTVTNFVKVNGTLTVESQAIFNNNATINGRLTTVGGFSTSGSVDCDSITTGDIKSNSINATGGFTLNGSASLTGPTVVKGSLDVAGNTEIDGSLEVTSEFTTKSLYATTNAIIDGRLTANDSVIFTDSLTVGGKVTSQSGFYTPENIEAQGVTANSLTAQTLTITSGASIDGGLNTTGNTVTEGNLTLKGSCDITSTLTVAESVIVKAITVRDSVDINNRLTVIGATFLTGDVVQIGNKTATTTITGNLQLDSNRLTLTGSMIIYQDLNVTGDIVITGKSSFNGDLTAVKTTFSSTTVTGTLTAEVAEFNRRARFNDGLKSTSQIETESLRSSTSDLGSAIALDLYAKNSLNMGTGSTAKMDNLSVSSLVQTNPDNDSTFQSNLIVSKDIKGQGSLILGDETIQYSNQAKGAYLTTGKLTLGEGSTITADTFTAKPGVPKADTQGTTGYTFDTLNNTGIYGDPLGNVAKTSINFYVEGVNKAFITKEDIGTNYPSSYDKHIVTLDLLKSSMQQLREELAVNPYAMVDKCYPINTIFQTMDDRDPNAILGVGVWMRFSSGRVLVGKVAPSQVGGEVLGGISPQDYNPMGELGKIGGVYEQNLTEEQLPHVDVRFKQRAPYVWVGNSGKNGGMSVDYTDHDNIASFGNNKPHNNVQPYITVGIWRRIG